MRYGRVLSAYLCIIVSLIGSASSSESPHDIRHYDLRIKPDFAAKFPVITAVQCAIGSAKRKKAN